MKTNSKNRLNSLLFLCGTLVLPTPALCVEAGDTGTGPKADAAAPIAVAAAKAAPVEEGSTPPKRALPKDVIMAKVGDKDITVMEFMQFLAANPSYLEMAMKQPGKTKILRAMISDQLLQRAMAREGLLSTDKPISGEDYVAAYEKLAKEHFPVGAMPSDEDLYAYYESHPQEFGIPASVHLRQIQLRVPKDATPEQQAAVRKQAEELLQRLEQGEGFTALAAEYTENPRAKVTKGDVGFLPRGTDPWLDEALQGIQPGQHTDVLKSKVGYEILQVVEQKDAVLIPFANVRTKVVEKVFNQRLNRARDRYLAELANEFGVEVLSPGLEAANPALYGAEAEGVSNEPAK